ncbi:MULTISPECIES: DUF397 domain-containing protein [unclassified Streptomyces]|uniref:DUF397 domain-containing protein n=1 Tax=unclassified Streptomyces TaxID=2593676 RepID=UPI00225AB6CF|nr:MULTISPECIES: DUF397 domain-containing protein [unclassified Streptomyces]MCX5246276.1 DUF397 domain-containing protein [Streptomyces sp. NBC_00201]MCX5287901.1 DUF397 domain-containing protein [Streptomyces sp. NBC_00183]
MWFTSTYSNGAGGECVECALVDESALVRDSKSAKDPVVPVVTIRSGAWSSFVQALKDFKLT